MKASAACIILLFKKGSPQIYEIAYIYYSFMVLMTGGRCQGHPDLPCKKQEQWMKIVVKKICGFFSFNVDRQ